MKAYTQMAATAVSASGPGRRCRQNASALPTTVTASDAVSSGRRELSRVRNVAPAAVASDKAAETPRQHNAVKPEVTTPAHDNHPVGPKRPAGGIPPMSSRSSIMAVTPSWIVEESAEEDAVRVRHDEALHVSALHAFDGFGEVGIRSDGDRARFHDVFGRAVVGRFEPVAPQLSLDDSMVVDDHADR